MKIDNRRLVIYTENGQKGYGHCLLITGGIYNPPIAVIERNDGTMTEIPIKDVQFVDGATQWKSEPKAKPELGRCQYDE